MDLASAQAEAGHRVHLIGLAGAELRHAFPKGVTRHAMPLPLFRAARLNALLSTLQVDVCHGHLGPACRAVAHTGGALRVGTLHVGYKPRQHAGLDGLICVNREQLSSLAKYPGRSQVVFNWPPRPNVSNPPSGSGAPGFAGARKLRYACGLSDGRVLIGTVARLHFSKGLDVLIQAFKRYAPGHASLVIVGEGPMKRRLRELAGGHPGIHFLGYRDDVDTILSELDLFVSPSREEALPLVVLEAMRAGLPIVATNTAGVRQLLAGAAATLVPTDDVDALGRVIQAHIRGLDSRWGRSTNSRVTYDMSLYDRDAAVARIEAFYRRLLAADAVVAARGPVDRVSH